MNKTDKFVITFSIILFMIIISLMILTIYKEKVYTEECIHGHIILIGHSGGIAGPLGECNEK